MSQSVPNVKVLDVNIDVDLEFGVYIIFYLFMNLVDKLLLDQGYSHVLNVDNKLLHYYITSGMNYSMT